MKMNYFNNFHNSVALHYFEKKIIKKTLFTVSLHVESVFEHLKVPCAPIQTPPTIHLSPTLISKHLKRIYAPRICVTAIIHSPLLSRFCTYSEVIE